MEMEPRGEELLRWVAAQICFVSGSAWGGLKGKKVSDMLLTFGEKPADGTINLTEHNGADMLGALLKARATNRPPDWRPPGWVGKPKEKPKE